MGTLSALVSFNPEKKSFTTIDKEKDGTPFTSQRITILFRDSHKRLWVGGEEGISVFQQEGIEIEKVPILPESSVTMTFTTVLMRKKRKSNDILRLTVCPTMWYMVFWKILSDVFG